MDYLIYYLTALVTAISLFYAYAKYKLSYWSRRGVKTPPTHLIFGNFKECIILKKPPGEVLREIYNSADPGDPYIGFYIFHKPMLLLRDRDLIKQVMITDFEVFPNRRFGSKHQRDMLGLDSLLSIHQPRWKYLRSKLSPIFTGQKLKNTLPLMVECGKDMLNFIEKSTTKSGVCKCEIRDITSRFLSNISASITFGITANSFDERENAFWKGGLKIFRGVKSAIMFNIFFFVPEWASLISPLFKGCANFFRQVFWDSMNNREKMGYKRGDVIDSMLALKNGEQNPLYKFEGDNLLAQATSFYIAGFEAPSATIAFALYNLARHPEYQTKVYDEIQSHLSGKELTVDVINEMFLLESIITESLRLYPPLPVLDRIATRNYVFPGTGLTIEKGVSVYVSVNAITHDHKNYSDPQDFIPLRKHEKVFENLPFGIGPRMCIGQRLGLLITEVALITIISNYQFELETTNKQFSKENDAIHLFTYSANGLYMHFKKRDKCT